eukprot:5642538-Prymnesium_polylepis.1
MQLGEDATAPMRVLNAPCGSGCSKADGGDGGHAGRFEWRPPAHFIVRTALHPLARLAVGPLEAFRAVGVRHAPASTAGADARGLCKASGSEANWQGER